MTSDITSIQYSAPESGTFSVDIDTCSITTDHEVITCRTAIGAGANLEWSVVISGQQSSNPVTSYAVPTVTGVAGTNVDSASTDGGDAIVLTGYVVVARSARTWHTLT